MGGLPKGGAGKKPLIPTLSTVIVPHTAGVRCPLRP